jgi:mono/diheme cytochrome c family protein
MNRDSSKLPPWVLPILVGVPLWAVFYGFAFSPPKPHAPVDPLVLGAQIYRSQGCSGCHGPNGEGVGTFPKLVGGQANLTFPNIADHIDWVRTGSQGKPIGTPYGDPHRPGGQHIVHAGVMPSFAYLSPTEINAVVMYERERL